MKRLSPKRLGALLLLESHGQVQGGWVYLPGFRDSVLERFGLTVYDTATFTCAGKAGLIEFDPDHGDGKCFCRLTEQGRALLQATIQQGKVEKENEPRLD